MPRLSAVIITRNAKKKLVPCLESLRFADDILVYDGGSCDGTPEIAREHGARVAIAPDWQGFGIQRRRAQAEAGGEWIFMIDADERVTRELAEEIKAAVAVDDPQTAYAIPRRTWAFGRYLAHSGWWPDFVVRLYHRRLGQYDDALVHEQVRLEAGVHIARLKYPLLHHSYQNMREYLEKSASYAEAWADSRARRRQTASLPAGIAHAVGCFFRMYILRVGFLDGRAGFLLALLSAHSTFVKYADLWLRSHDAGPS